MSSNKDELFRRTEFDSWVKVEQFLAGIYLPPRQTPDYQGPFLENQSFDTKKKLMKIEMIKQVHPFKKFNPSKENI